jgi:hemerythrin-like domain-containing protein
MSMPVVVLIDEHKLILQAVAFIKAKITETKTSKTVNPNLITTIVDFFRTYADRFHHGKEEGILFNELLHKQLSESDKKTMNELIMEHVFARRTVTALENAKGSYVSGKNESLNAILDSLETLVDFYPKHIEKEDKHFFYPSMTYFSSQEQESMLKKFEEFNRSFTDKRYNQVVNSLK